MKMLPHIILGALLVVFVGLGSIQGEHLGHLRQADTFYRWLVTSSTQLRVFGTVTPALEGDEADEFQDEDLFQAIVDKTEPLLEDVPEADDDKDADGKVYPKLVRYTRTLASETVETDEEGNVIGRVPQDPEQLRRDRAIWKLARGPELAEERERFATLLSEGKLASAGAQVGVADLYRDKEAPVSLSQMFLGFRKMAANLLWLEVDENFHKGYTERMLPLMQTTVLLDPNFIDAYLIGAWHLAYNATAQMPDTPERDKVYDEDYGAWVGDKERLYHAAAVFLKDGIKNNPRDYRLYFDLGFATYELKLNDHVNAIRYLTEATRQRHDAWVPRMLYKSMQLNGQYEDAITGWEDYLTRFPDNEVAPRAIATNKGLIKERDAEKATDPAEKAKLYAEARAIWEELLSKPGGDPFAQTRLERMEALKLRDQGRYEEAIALLQHARLQNSEFFQEGSELIIEIKRENNEPLNVSEKKWLLGKQEADDHKVQVPVTIAGRTFKFDLRNTTWHQEGYNQEETTALDPTSEQTKSLIEAEPELDKIMGLGRVVIFQARNAQGQDTWFELHRSPVN